MGQRAFGADALGQIGLGLIVLVAAAAIVVRVGRHDLAINRSVSPHRSPAERVVSIDLDITNRGRGSAPLVLMEDTVPAPLGTRARFAFAGIEPRGGRKASYRLRPRARGRYELGPVAVSFLDPFSLARSRSFIASVGQLLVHPKIQELALPSDLGERRSLVSSALRRPTGSEGEDFYTLREYVEGDDLRKIHWPSTAKRQRYMIRQEETPWHNRATVVLDDRRAAHGATAAAFERAVEAAASVVDLYHRAGYSFRLAGAHEPGFPSARGSNHYNRCLDLLATIGLRSTTSVGPNGTDPMLAARFAELEARDSGAGTLVLVAGDLTPDVAVGLANVARRFNQVIVIAFPSHRFSSQPTRARWEGEQRTVEGIRLLGRSGVRTIVLGPGDSLSIAWAGLSRAVMGGERTWEPKPARA